MNVVVLIVILCSLVNPQTCSEKHFLFEANGSLDGCMMQAQPYLAQWVNEHPNDRVASYRCAWPDQEGKNL